MNRPLWFPALGCVLITGLGAITSFTVPSQPTDQSRDVLQWGYQEWVAMAPTDQEAYLQGFLSGAAVVEAERLSVEESLRVAIAMLRAKQQLTFELQPNVYQVRIAEYYFWENHRPEPIAQAMYAVDSALANP